MFLKDYLPVFIWSIGGKCSFVLMLGSSGNRRSGSIDPIQNGRDGFGKEGLVGAMSSVSLQPCIISKSFKEACPYNLNAGCRCFFFFFFFFFYSRHKLEKIEK